MCTGEDLDDSNTLRTGRLFYLKAKKKYLFSKNTRIRLGPLNTSLGVKPIFCFTGPAPCPLSLVHHERMMATGRESRMKGAFQI